MTRMAALQGATLALRFLLELAMLAAMGYAGRRAGGDAVVLQTLFAVIAVLVAAVWWGAFLSPKRRIDLPFTARLAMETVLFAVAALALVLGGHIVLGTLLAVLWVVHRILMAAWDQTGAHGPRRHGIAGSS